MNLWLAHVIKIISYTWKVKMVGNWHLQIVSINFVPHFYIDREKSPQKELLHGYSSHTVIRVKIVNDCSILKWVTPVLDTIWTLPRCMPRKTKEPQYSCHIRKHHYNSRSCKAFAVGRIICVSLNWIHREYFLDETCRDCSFTCIRPGSSRWTNMSTSPSICYWM